MHGLIICGPCAWACAWPPDRQSSPLARSAVRIRRILVLPVLVSSPQPGTTLRCSVVAFARGWCLPPAIRGLRPDLRSVAEPAHDRIGGRGLGRVAADPKGRGGLGPRPHQLARVEVVQLSLLEPCQAERRDRVAGVDGRPAGRERRAVGERPSRQHGRGDAWAQRTVDGHEPRRRVERRGPVGARAERLGQRPPSILGVPIGLEGIGLGQRGHRRLRRPVRARVGRQETLQETWLGRRDRLAGVAARRGERVAGIGWHCLSRGRSGRQGHGPNHEQPKDDPPQRHLLPVADADTTGAHGWLPVGAASALPPAPLPVPLVPEAAPAAADSACWLWHIRVRMVRAALARAGSPTAQVAPASWTCPPSEKRLSSVPSSVCCCEARSTCCDGVGVPPLATIDAAMALAVSPGTSGPALATGPGGPKIAAPPAGSTGPHGATSGAQPNGPTPIGVYSMDSASDARAGVRAGIPHGSLPGLCACAAGVATNSSPITSGAANSFCMYSLPSLLRPHWRSCPRIKRITWCERYTVGVSAAQGRMPLASGRRPGPRRPAARTAARCSGRSARWPPRPRQDPLDTYLSRR